MIKATELRIGNLVFAGKTRSGQSHYLAVVEQVLKDKAILDWPSRGPTPEFGTKAGPVDLSAIDAIPLAEEWLERLGWTKWSGGYLVPLFENRPTSLIFSLDDTELRIMVMDGNGYVTCIAKDVKFVHQIQNLFFALTGEELTIKERV